MEWSLHIKGAEDLRGPLTLDRAAGLESSAAIRPLLALTARLIHDQFGAITFTRCQFGNEFCENLIPAPAALTAAVAAAYEQQLGFTFLTPFVSNKGLAALRPHLAILARYPGAEIVFSDWGVLNVLRREFPMLVPVQGRLLNKSLRDPRVTPMYAITPSPATAQAAVQGSNLDNTAYTSFLQRQGVRLVEMDNLPQGNDLGFTGNGVGAAAYLPFGFISASRICMAAGLHYHKGDKFQPGAPCRHECQTHLLEYSYTNSPFGNRDQKFYLKGNTYFYLHTEPMLRTLLEQAANGRIARLNLQPRLPMMTG